MRLTSKLINIFSLVVLLMVLSCVDIDNQNIFPQDYKSEVKFVNLTSLGTANVLITDIDKSMGNIPAYGYSEYQEIPSGGRKIEVTYADATPVVVDTLKIVFETERKSTVFIVEDSSSNRSYFNRRERYIFDTPTVADSVILRAFNGHPEGFDVSITATNLDHFEIDTVGTQYDTVYTDTLIVTTLSYSKTSPYKKLYPGTFAVSVDTSNVTVFSDTLVFSANKRYTIVVYDKITSIEDD